MRTEQSPSVTLRLVSVGKADNGDALSPFGPVRAGLTISQRTEADRQLTELVKCFEIRVATLESKFCALLDTVLLDTATLAEPRDLTTDETFTK